MIHFIIFSLGQRTGSGWLSRLLHSTGEAIVWGEPGLLRFAHHYLCATQTTEVEPAVNGQDLHGFRTDPLRMFPSSLAPMRWDAERALAEFSDRYLSLAAASEGRRLCGFKETDFTGGHLQFVARHWPGTRIVFLWRPFLEGIESANGAGWIWGNHPLEWCERFIRTSEAVIDYFTAGGLNARLLRYTDVGTHGKEICRHLFCQMPPAARVPLVDDVVHKPLGSRASQIEPYLARIQHNETLLEHWASTRGVTSF